MSFPHYLVFAYEADAHDASGVHAAFFDRITDAVKKAQEWADEPSPQGRPDLVKTYVAIFKMVEEIKDVLPPWKEISEARRVS